MPTAINKKKYLLPVVGVCILVILIVSAFYALMFGKKIFQGSIGDVSEGSAPAVRFELQKVKGLSGISE